MIRGHRVARIAGWIFRRQNSCQVSHDFHQRRAGYLIRDSSRRTLPRSPSPAAGGDVVAEVDRLPQLVVVQQEAGTELLALLVRNPNDGTSEEPMDLQLLHRWILNPPAARVPQFASRSAQTRTRTFPNSTHQNRYQQPAGITRKPLEPPGIAPWSVTVSSRFRHGFVVTS